MLPTLEHVQMLVKGMNGVKDLRTMKLRPRKNDRDYLFRVDFQFQDGENLKLAKTRFQNFFSEQGWTCNYCQAYKDTKNSNPYAEIELVIANPG